MPFLTLEDPNAKIKGSRDPLGAQPIWSHFARHFVTNVTGSANSVRGFTLLLLGRYFADRLVSSGDAQTEDTLDIALRMEQIGAYARHVGHGVDADIRGIERVKVLLQEHQGRPFIETGPRGRILSDQRVNGLWGLYTVSARASGLLPEGPTGVTTASADLIERAYRPILEPVESQLLKILASGGRIQTSKKDPLFRSLCRLLPETLSQEESLFYAHHLRDARETDGAGRRGRQANFVDLLGAHTDLDVALTRAEAISLREGATATDPSLARALSRTIHLESCLAPADALFDHVLARGGNTPEEIDAELKERWGPTVPNLDSSAFGELLPEIESVASKPRTEKILRCQNALAAGQYADAVRALLDWNEDLMKSRKAAPWARLSPDGRVEVRYRGTESRLPTGDEIATLWKNQYYVDSLKRITRQVANTA